MAATMRNGSERSVGIAHRDAINALSEFELVDLKARNNASGLLRFAIQLALLTITGTAIIMSPSTWLTALAILAHGLLLVFLFAPLHECIHETAFRSHWLNQVIAAAAGFLLLLPPRYFRYFHLAHHRHTQDEVMDPELASPKPNSWPSYIWQLTGIDYWRGQIWALISCARGRQLPSFVPKNGRAKVVTEARIYCFAYVMTLLIGVLTSLTWLVWLWVLPALMGQPFLRAYLLAEHTGCPYVPDMLANSRTVFAGRVIQWLAWNMPNHTAHHAMPSVPFHQLPQLTAMLRSNLKATSPSYIDAQKEITQAF